ncbi:FlgD immunoglobulin-like domain containing protein [Gaiella sp.]|uniref:FlgD immunoglobulin-like domain containing protein n=1 Tax=Gaiella sp. TaxID=2663207 RepID=UPI003982F4A0
MARFAPAALAAALLAATALAFLYTESLKLTPSPILGTRVLPKVISPVCNCPTDSAVIAFRLREADVVGVEIIDGDGDVVRNLALRESVPRGAVSYVWNGRTDLGTTLPEGSYRPRVRLRRQHRTIVLPNPIRVDTTPPVVRMTRLVPRVFSPDGDARRDRVVVGYRVDEPSRISLYVDGKRVVVKKGRKTEGTIDWFGRSDGEPLPQDIYTLRLGAVDVAGNEGGPTRSKPVVIRYVALGRTSVATTPGGRVAVLVLSDAARVTWKLGARTGVARPGTLRLRAPLQPGRFTLTVTANGRSARAAVLVRSPPP